MQVLEIETFINKLIEDTAMWFQVGICQEGIKHRLTLDKNKTYYTKDIKEYLSIKYPNNEFIKNNPEIIDNLYNLLLTGNNLCEVEGWLYKMNLNQDSMQISELEQRRKFIEEYNNSSGVDIFWYNLLKLLVINYHSESEYSNEDILVSYLGLVDNILKTKRNRSILDLDNSIFPNKPPCGINTTNFEFVNKYELVERNILKFRDSIYYYAFSTLCEENGISFYYLHKNPEKFLFDSIAFSINLISQRIKKNTHSLFDFDLRNNTSLYPQDLINRPFKLLQVYISPFGFYSFKKVIELFHKGLLETELKSFLSKYFEIVDKSAVIDNEDYLDEGNKYNSSLIFGRDLIYRTFWGRRTQDYVNKLISGSIWFNDDVHPTNLGYL